jgi:phosphoglycerate dehydrogenase-like enzyme
MIAAREFAVMKRGVVLINVSRRKVVATDALVAALDSGQVAAAGPDVTGPEPLPKGHPLWSRNVIITPHSAGQSPGDLSEGRGRICWRKTHSRLDTRTSLADFENASVVSDRSVF